MSGAGGDAFAVRSLGSARFFYRPPTIDEEVLRASYQDDRFFPPGCALSDAETILDVGAHIGVFAILAARRAPHARVYAVEPERENCALLGQRWQRARRPPEEMRLLGRRAVE